ncbi:MAG TPA: Gfo/Idh/MocA family oxidoreductase [Planctomycetaceae bacterium]|nr:Gfo/Idh/MocA family oxidoreductase [Planctomycetaceae bacterium]
MKIKYGQIGVGHAHANKIAVYRQSPDWEVVGVVESDPELRRRAEKDPLYRDLPFMTREQLLNTPGLQVVGVETLVRDLLDTAETCLAAGMHIHLDKPAGESLPQFQRLLDEAARKHRVVQMGYMFRYNPAVLMLREFLKNGWLGEPFEVHTVMSKVVPPSDRRTLAEYPGGIMFELGCHVIDLVVSALGKPDSVKSFARKVGPQDDRLLDNMLAVFGYPRALASVKASAVEIDGGERRHFVVCGSEGTFHIQPLDAPSVRFTLSQPRGKYGKGYQEVRFGNYPRYVGDAADLAKIVRHEKEPDYSYQHDLTVQETILKASGQPTQ